MTQAELNAKYTRTHCEEIVRKDTHVHWYNLLVMLAVYYELPTANYIPNKIKGNKLKKWVVPKADVERILREVLTRGRRVPPADAALPGAGCSSVQYGLRLARRPCMVPSRTKSRNSSDSMLWSCTLPGPKIRRWVETVGPSAPSVCAMWSTSTAPENCPRPREV
jgi:hypothetical protein